MEGDVRPPGLRSVRAFVDTTVPAYASGTPHPLQRSCLLIRAAIKDNNVAVVVNAEVLKELFHVALRHRASLREARAIAQSFDLVMGRQASPITRDLVMEAVALDVPSSLGGRDRLHLATMRRESVVAIISADRGFDLVPGIRRLDPLHFESRRGEVFGTA